MQGMDVYVVLHFKGMRATVLGAATDRDGARVIADRHAGGKWKAWERQEALGRDIRSADMTNEDQTITRVPLAGYLVEVPVELMPFGRGIPPLITRSEIEEIGRAFGAP
jgi:hypothetical protein